VIKSPEAGESDCSKVDDLKKAEPVLTWWKWLLLGVGSLAGITILGFIMYKCAAWRHLVRHVKLEPSGDEYRKIQKISENVSQTQSIEVIKIGDPFNIAEDGFSVEFYDGTDAGLWCENTNQSEWNAKMLTCYYNTFHKNEGPLRIATICSDVDSTKVVLYPGSKAELTLAFETGRINSTKLDELVGVTSGWASP
jgi:hypothetical protein